MAEAFDRYYPGSVARLPQALAISAALLAIAGPSSALAAAEYTVSYRGEGHYLTQFRAHPPNPGGRDDRNFARDSSRQRWAIRFRRALEIPACGQPTDGSADPCTGVTGLSGAGGLTLMSGRVYHRHVDGIYRVLDRTVKCRLRKRTSSRRRLVAELRVRYLPDSKSFGITALNPLTTAVSLFPAQCAGQGDSIDRIADFYAMPGFSFAADYGPDRWFSSREAIVPADRLLGSSRIKLRLADTPAGTPPRRCARLNPSYERCRTGGSWNGVLTLTPKSTSATASAVRLKRPRGTYTGPNDSPMLLVSGRSIDLAAFAFQCGKVTGRTNLNSIAIRKRRGRYRFAIRAHGSVTYSDDHPDENAAVRFSGHFTPRATRAFGSFRVKTPRCGGTGAVDWSARHQAG